VVGVTVQGEEVERVEEIGEIVEACVDPSTCPLIYVGVPGEISPVGFFPWGQTLPSSYREPRGNFLLRDFFPGGRRFPPSTQL
jgi:hypothetical protein